MTEENAQVAEETEVTPTEEVTTPEDNKTEVVEPVVTQARFNQVYYRSKQAERDNRNLQDKLSVLEQKFENRNPETPVNAPSIADFDYDDEKFAQANSAYNEKMIDQRINDAVNRKMEGIGQSEARLTRQKIEQDFFKRSDDYLLKNPEYNDVLENAIGVEINPAASDIIMQSQNGPALHHYLLSNPLELEKLNSLQSPGLVGMEMGRLEGKLNVKQRTHAPNPINPESSGGGSASSKDVNDPNISMEEYYKLRTTQ